MAIIEHELVIEGDHDAWLPGGGIDLDQRLDHINAALDLVGLLCLPTSNPQHRKWTMSIPARPDHDPDLVIARALGDAAALVAEIGTLRERVGVLERRVQAMIDQHGTFPSMGFKSDLKGL